MIMNCRYLSLSCCFVHHVTTRIQFDLFTIFLSKWMNELEYWHNYTYSWNCNIFFLNWKRVACKDVDVTKYVLIPVSVAFVDGNEGSSVPYCFVLTVKWTKCKEDHQCWWMQQSILQHGHNNLFFILLCQVFLIGKFSL